MEHLLSILVCLLLSLNPSQCLSWSWEPVMSQIDVEYLSHQFVEFCLL